MMKKAALAALAMLTLAALLAAAPARPAETQNDFQTIQKAVKDNPAYEAGKDVKWFKVLITDAKTNKDRVRVTLPLALVEIVLRHTDGKHLNVGDSHTEIDLAALFAELKKLGPMALIEVYEDDEIIKIWLE
ncbi:MAG: hypothetical protein R6X21_08000 [Candidatus Aminicenantes bacterium]